MVLLILGQSMASCFLSLCRSLPFLPLELVCSGTWRTAFTPALLTLICEPPTLPMFLPFLSPCLQMQPQNFLQAHQGPVSSRLLRWIQSTSFCSPPLS